MVLMVYSLLLISTIKTLMEWHAHYLKAKSIIHILQFKYLILYSSYFMLNNLFDNNSIFFFPSGIYSISEYYTVLWTILYVVWRSWNTNTEFRPTHLQLLRRPKWYTGNLQDGHDCWYKEKLVFFFFFKYTF